MNANSSRTHPLPVLLTIGALLSMWCKARAEDKAELVPEDTCIIELTLPEGATVKLQGQDYGTKRELTYNSLKPGQTIQAPLEISYPSGKKSEHTLLLEGGRRVRFASGDPNATLPELVTPRVTAACGIPQCLFSPDETKFLLYEGNAALHDVSNGRLLRVFPVSGTALRFTCSAQHGVTFLSTGQKLLIGLSTWDVASGRTAQTLGVVNK